MMMMGGAVTLLLTPESISPSRGIAAVVVTALSPALSPASWLLPEILHLSPAAARTSAAS